MAGKLRLWHVLFLLAVMVTLHFIANATKLYAGEIIWVDNILHMMAGAAMAMLWIVITKKNTVFHILFFVLMLALLWEAVELLFMILFPVAAIKYGIYSVSMLEAGADTLMNLIGGGIIVYLFIRK